MGFISRLRGLFQRDKLARELDDEMAFHLAMRERAARYVTGRGATYSASALWQSGSMARTHERD